jgi:hypothetical protein
MNQMSRKILTDPRRKWALFLYGVGYAFGLLIAVGTIWPDLEASLFGRDIYSVQRHVERSMPLRCPVFLTPADGSGEVRASLINPSDERGAQVPVRARISDGYVSLVREVYGVVQLEPGERKVLAYDIYESDVTFNRFILVRVYAIRSTPYPGGQATCGVWWLDIPLLKGWHLLALLLFFSVAGLAYGNYVWQRFGGDSSRSIEFGQFLLVMTGLILLVIFSGLMGWWLIGILLLAILVLILAMFGLVIEYFGGSD